LPFKSPVQEVGEFNINSYMGKKAALPIFSKMPESGFENDRGFNSEVQF